MELYISRNFFIYNKIPCLQNRSEPRPFLNNRNYKVTQRIWGGRFSYLNMLEE